MMNRKQLDRLTLFSANSNCLTHVFTDEEIRHFITYQFEAILKLLYVILIFFLFTAVKTRCLSSGIISGLPDRTIVDHKLTKL